jgi:hypothetical protein
MWNLISIPLEAVLVSVQDICTVRAKHAVGSEIILDAPMVPLCGKSQVDALLGPFGDSANLDAR